MRCNARETTPHAFVLKNLSSQAKTYSIESDLPFVSGAPTVDVPGNGQASYTLNFAPSLGGAYAGSVTFADQVGQYIWYTVKVQVDSPLEDSSIDMTAVVRQAASAGITLVNPLPEAIEFDVALEGDGVIGPSRFTLGPAGEGTYELFYAPLVARTHGGSVAFLNDRVGEFWYKLNLTGTPAAPSTLPTLECQVGARTSATVTIENPLEREIALEGSVSNGANFVVEATTLIPPYKSAEIEIVYVPSEIGAVQSCTVVLSHEALGDWEYVVNGVGTTPGLMPEHRPSALVGDPQSYMFNFRNPSAAARASYAGAFEIRARSRRDFRRRSTERGAVPSNITATVDRARCRRVGPFRRGSTARGPVQSLGETSKSAAAPHAAVPGAGSRRRWSWTWRSRRRRTTRARSSCS